MNRTELINLPAHALSETIRSREVSCREVMEATLAWIGTVNPVHNAIVSLRDPDDLIHEADVRDAELNSRAASNRSICWMHGLPQAIKDAAQTAGIPTTFGSRLLRDFVPSKDGLMVQRMKAAGCIVIGKTNTPEFGLGSHTFNEVFGATRNAYDPSKSAGGSSGGAAVALATRMLAVADGSDFMGSLRNPAGWNNVFALRPSVGRVPLWPAQDVWIAQLGTEGPMGRTARDVALLLDVQAGHDPRVPLSLPDEAPFADELDALDCSRIRIGWLADLSGHLLMEPGILEVCDKALHRLMALGCKVDAMQPAFAPVEVWRAWLTWRRLLVAARLAPHLMNPKNRASIKPEALWEYDQATTLRGTEVTSASAQRSSFYQQILGMFDDCDVLALPTAQVWPFDVALRWPTHINGHEMDTYHRWMEVTIYSTFAGLPCMAVPAGFGPAGLPMGLQLIGRPRDERTLLRLAHAYENVARDILDVRRATAGPR